MDYLREKAGKIHFAITNRGLKCASSKDIAGLCKYFGFSPQNVRAVLVRKGALVPILFKGLFYVRNPSELLTNTLPVDPLLLASLACNKRFGSEWYFGLHTALKLNGLGGQQAQTKTNAVTKKRVTPRIRNIGKFEFIFSQIKGIPFNQGIIEKKGLRFSDPVKTALDFLYLGIKTKNTKYAELVLDVALARNRKRFMAEYPKLLLSYSSKKRMKTIIEKHLAGFHAL